MIDDKNLLSLIKTTMIKENEESKAYVAFRHHGDAWNKILKVHTLLSEIHGHLLSAEEQKLGGDHIKHLSEAHEHLHNAEQHLNKVQLPLSAANVISHKLAYPEEHQQMDNF